MLRALAHFTYNACTVAYVSHWRVGCPFLPKLISLALGTPLYPRLRLGLVLLRDEYNDLYWTSWPLG